MGVAKFRSVADMSEPPMATTPLAGVAAACALSELSSAFGDPIVGPRGVRKFRSVAEASDYRQAWEDAAMQGRAVADRSG